MAGLSARIVLAFGIAVSVAVGIASGAASQADGSAAEARAWAIQVVVPGGGGGTDPADAASGEGSTSAGGYVYPGDGTVVAAGEVTAAASVADQEAVSTASASSGISGIVIFGGEITADLVEASARARAGSAGATGGFDGTRVVNLRVFGRPASGAAAPLEDWGVLTVRAEESENDGSYRGTVTALVIRLTAEHRGMPAGSEILLGRAEVSAEPPQASGETAPARTTPGTQGTPGRVAPDEPEAGEGTDRAVPGFAFPIPLPPEKSFQPDLEGGPYVFPVYGDSSYGNTFGAPRATVEYHHGADIFGEVGQPIVAVADGTVFSVGYQPIGGLRLWLRDRQGNEFYYAHLSAFSTLASNGARVKAGQVVGFMGATGDAQGADPHLHFEIHPVSLLYLGYDGAVDPTSYLDSWKRVERLPTPLPLAWAPTVPGAGSAPRPGAVLLASSDISTATGLDPASLRRAMEAVPARP